jgi:hypothetical protein
MLNFAPHNCTDVVTHLFTFEFMQRKTSSKTWPSKDMSLMAVHSLTHFNLRPQTHRGLSSTPVITVHNELMNRELKIPMKLQSVPQKPVKKAQKKIDVKKHALELIKVARHKVIRETDFVKLPHADFDNFHPLGKVSFQEFSLPRAQISHFPERKSTKVSRRPYTEPCKESMPLILMHPEPLPYSSRKLAHTPAPRRPMPEISEPTNTYLDQIKSIVTALKADWLADEGEGWSFKTPAPALQLPSIHDTKKSKASIKSKKEVPEPIKSVQVKKKVAAKQSGSDELGLKLEVTELISKGRIINNTIEDILRQQYFHLN